MNFYLENKRFFVPKSRKCASALSVTIIHIDVWNNQFPYLFPISIIVAEVLIYKYIPIKIPILKELKKYEDYIFFF